MMYHHHDHAQAIAGRSENNLFEAVMATLPSLLVPVFASFTPESLDLVNPTSGFFCFHVSDSFFILDTFCRCDMSKDEVSRQHYSQGSLYYNISYTVLRPAGSYICTNQHSYIILKQALSVSSHFE